MNESKQISVPAAVIYALTLCTLTMSTLMLPARVLGESAMGLVIPKKLKCTAEATAGLHDYPHNPASYEPVVFYESSFELRANAALNRHLAPSSGVDAYLTMTHDKDVLELACAQVRGSGGSVGISCRNDPPSEFVLLNLSTLHFSRTAIGGWVFASADTATASDYEGDSLFVEYGYCSAD